MVKIKFTSWTEWFILRCDYNLCRPCYEGNLVYEALEDVEEGSDGGGDALTFVPDTAEAAEEGADGDHGKEVVLAEVKVDSAEVKVDLTEVKVDLTGLKVDSAEVQIDSVKAKVE